MTEKPDNTRAKTRKPLRNKSAIRVPISLHFYAVEIVVIILVVFIINIYIQSIFKNYIAYECISRINVALESMQVFAEKFYVQLGDSADDTDENVRAYLLNSIAKSADISNQANIVLYYLDPDTNEYLVLWPTASNTVAYVNNANNVIEKVVAEEGYKDWASTQTLVLDGDLIYYKSTGFTWKTKPTVQSDDTSIVTELKNPELEDYYICVYVNSSSYYSFMASMTLALIQAALLAALIAGVLSMIMTYPIIYSSQKLSKFARRIAKGDFKPVRGHLVSKELSELGDVMNQMAYKLEKSDIEQKTFFQNASHELRTPLMSIQGYAEGLKYGVFESPADRDNAIDVIIDETGRLSNLVENLLSISKMDMSRSGNFEVKKQNIDAIKICDSILDRVRGNFIHEDKAIINNISITSTYIYANENDLIRCLENIFSNCLRYCKSAVTFACKTDDTGSNVIFEISDDGPGIAPEVIEHLFERFSKGADGKHGIGLALAKAIAEEHGGSIKAYNKPEGGACFDVMIPVTFYRNQLSKMNNDSAK